VEVFLLVGKEGRYVNYLALS